MLAVVVALLAWAGGCINHALRSHVARAAPARHGAAFTAFYVGWDDKARASLARNVGALDVFAPMWVTVRGPQAELVPEDDPQTQALLAQRRTPPRIMPIVSNAHDDIWDAEAAGQAILDPATQGRLAQGLADLARTRGLAGYIFDFETLKPKAAAGFPAFLQAMRADLGPKGLQIWAVAPTDPDAPLADLAVSADAVVVMAYDECWPTSNPGPVAGADWVRAMLAQRLRGIDPRKVVVALASYGYDWPKGGRARVISASDALALASSRGVAVRRDPASANATFRYVDAKGTHREVWMVDAPAFALERRLASAVQPKGVALWRLGLEDPGLWSRSAPVLEAPPPLAAGAALPHPCDPLEAPPG